MQRLTARLLLLIALAGNFIPVALAATAAPPHACCLRKAAHRCHDSMLAESDQPALRATGCCNHDCCRAVTTSQWASPPPSAKTAFTKDVDVHIAESCLDVPVAEPSASLSTRAPPADFLA
jgi:hypothetical protein